jgi:hypothetical protein
MFKSSQKVAVATQNTTCPGVAGALPAITVAVNVTGFCAATLEGEATRTVVVGSVAASSGFAHKPHNATQKIRAGKRRILVRKLGKGREERKLCGIWDASVHAGLLQNDSEQFLE